MDGILKKINQSALKFLEPLSLEATCSAIVEEAVKLVKAEYGSIYLSQSSSLEKVYSSFSGLAKIKPRKGGYTYKALREKRAFVLDTEGVVSSHPEIKSLGIKSTIFIPLFNTNKTVGVLSVDSKKEEHFSAEELGILKLFGSMASLAIRKAQLFESIEQALEIRDRFIALAAHELRTPITTISGYSQLLKSKLGNKGTPESKWSEEMTWEVFRLTQLVNELLEVNKIKTGQLDFLWKECRLKGILHRAESLFQVTYSNRQLSLDDDLGGDDFVVGDYDKLLQVIMNVLDNAAKFSPSEKVIYLSAKDGGNYFIIQIKDHGKGIDKSEMGRIFEGFYKGIDNYKGGMGLGLLLTKFIVDSHHGLINLNSEINKGTTVEIKLPKLKYERS